MLRDATRSWAASAAHQVLNTPCWCPTCVGRTRPEARADELNLFASTSETHNLQPAHAHGEQFLPRWARWCAVDTQAAINVTVVRPWSDEGRVRSQLTGSHPADLRGAG
jgi:hypothetical protein